MASSTLITIPHRLKRYLKLYGQFFVYSFKREWEYKANLLSSILVDSFYYGINLLLFELIYTQVDTIGPYSKAHMQIFVLTFFLTECFWAFFFENNLGKLNTYIVQGELDLLVVRPIQSQFFVSFRYVNVQVLLNILFVIGGLAWVIQNHSIQISFHRCILYLGLCLNGALIIYVIDFYCNVIVFWSRKFTYARWLWYEIVKISHRPDSIYPAKIQKLLWVLPPLALVNSLPTRVLLLDFPLQNLLIVPVITLAFLASTHWVWQLALKRYESASS